MRYPEPDRLLASATIVRDGAHRGIGPSSFPPGSQRRRHWEGRITRPSLHAGLPLSALCHPGENPDDGGLHTADLSYADTSSRAPTMDLLYSLPQRVCTRRRRFSRRLPQKGMRRYHLTLHTKHPMNQRFQSRQHDQHGAITTVERGGARPLDVLRRIVPSRTIPTVSPPERGPGFRHVTATTPYRIIKSRPVDR